MNRRQKLNLLEECLKHIRATSNRYVEQMQWLKFQKELVLAEQEKVNIYSIYSIAVSSFLRPPTPP